MEGVSTFYPETVFFVDDCLLHVDEFGRTVVGGYLHQSTFDLSQNMRILEGFWTDGRSMKGDCSDVVELDDFPLEEPDPVYQKFSVFPENPCQLSNLSPLKFNYGFPDSFQQVLNENMVFDPFPYSFGVMGEVSVSSSRILLGYEGLYDYRRVLVSIAGEYAYPPMLSIIFYNDRPYRIIDGDKIEITYTFPNKIFKQVYRLDDSFSRVGELYVEDNLESEHVNSKDVE